MKTTLCILASISLAALRAAEVVVYSPKDAGGFAVSGAGRVTAFPAPWTGHRSVCAVPGASNDVFEAWTGGGAYAVGAPYGTSAGRDWPAVELTGFSPVMPRIDLRTGATDRAPTVAEYVAELYRIVREADVTKADRDYALENLAWTSNHAYTVAAPQTGERVRIVRWALDGQPVYRLGLEPEAVLDTRARLPDRAFLTESDILATGALDLDWDRLKPDVLDSFDVQNCGAPVTNVAYLVVIGDGKPAWDTDTDVRSCPRILDRVIERRFEFRRTRPTPVGSSLSGGVASFSFRIDGEEGAVAKWGTSYTAFKVRVRRAGASSDAWTSGVRRLPAKDPTSGVYSFASADPALTNALSTAGCTWQAALFNAKFSDDRRFGAALDDRTAEGTNVFSSAVLFTASP